MLKPLQPQKENKLLENELTKLLSNVRNNDCDGEGQPWGILNTQGEAIRVL